MKRVLLFLLLLGLGVAGLWFAIGDEAPVAAKTEASEPVERGPGGVPIAQGKIGVSVSQQGALSFPQYRVRPLPNGSARRERVFVLDSKKSEPLNESLQQLDDVTVTFFDDDQPAARLTAVRAFVELSRDAAGRPSLREDKEIDLREAVFVSLPGARLEGLRLELGNARVRIAEQDLLLRTATEDDPVLLVVDGERSATLRGKGLLARLPRDRDSTLRRGDITILHEPELETRGLVARARGRLDYREDLDRGEAIVTLDDTVQIDLDRGSLGGAGGAPATQIRGDRLTGWLVRSGQRTDADTDPAARDQVAWQKLLLTGAPATVELADGRLSTPRISVLRGLLGDPWLVTAHGGESRIEQTRLRPGSRQTELVTGTAPRRIHLVRPGASTGALLRAHGFPQWTLPALERQQVVVFEGEARLDDGVRTMTASRGLHLFHRDDAEGVAARGFGAVHVQQRATAAGEHDMVADGNDGFVLLATETAQDLRLGPLPPDDFTAVDAPWHAHHYTIRYGTAEATGTGACRIRRTGDQAQLWLRSPGSDIEGRLPDQRVELGNLRRLEVELRGDDVTALAAAGLPVRARRLGREDAIDATAPRLVQIGPRSLRLTAAEADDATTWLGLPAEHVLPVLRRTATPARGRATTAEVRGAWIDLHHVGGDDVVVDALTVADVLPVVDVELQAEAGGEPTRARCVADRVRALPFAISAEARTAHLGGAHSALALATFAVTAAPWLVVDGVRDFRLVDPVHGVVEGRGTRLLLSQGAQAGLFVGDPDRGEPAEVRRRHAGREVIARGARVRVFREQDVRLTALRTFEDRPTFLLPSVTLHQTGSTGLLSHMQATCQGNIDVLPDRVVFGGPVTAIGLRADGSEDPDGIALDARELLLRRDPRSGDVVRAIGRGVDVDWPQLRAKAAEVDLDVVTTRCVARDPARATVVLPGGRTITAPYVEVNWETLAYRARNVRIEQAADAGILPR
ncbi:MAG: hypothetical protein JNL08_21570 [Planctomycetes bacterium]|nr:hypothetical protein [Planctomycetota bacterium]